MGEPATSASNAYTAVIERVHEHTPDTRSLFLRLPSDRHLTFQPGQFLSFSLPLQGRTVTRAYSIASSPEEELLEICLNLVPHGLGSAYLFERCVGEPLHFTGPWGTFVLDLPLRAECVFLAEGTGIAPLRPMIRQALAEADKPPVQLLYGANQEIDLLYRQELEAWERANPHFRFVPILLDPAFSWSGGRGTWREHAEQRYVAADHNRSRQFFLCGVGSAVTQLRDLLRVAGYERRAVHYEKW